MQRNYLCKKTHMSTPVRVRFAPSPTGALHIGGIRTALFNYLFAKKNNGVFYLRIEDTDQTRFEPKAEKYILDSLSWLGISPSETVEKNEKFGPYRQSERTAIYDKYIKLLLDSGHAYYAFDTTNDLDLQRKEHEEQGKNFIYNHNNRLTLQNSLALSVNDVQQKLDQKTPFVVRFKTPDEILILNDMIRGEITFDTSLLDDKVLYKSDGLPTYHFANIIDDHLMETSHVIRGEEWLPSLPLHYMLYRAFGWEAPIFAHLPLILKPIGNGKLSKRDGDKLGFPVFPLGWETENGISEGYREQGYFPEAVLNFLALLGWNDGSDQEIFTLLELEEKFDLSRVHKAGAKFDPEKNKWFNHQYMQMQDNEGLAKEFANILQEKGISHTYDINNENIDKITLSHIVSLIKERANFVSDFWELSSYLFESPTVYDPKAVKNWTSLSASYLTKIISVLKNEPIPDVEAQIKNWATQQELNLGKVMQPLRLALVGSLKGIQVFDIIKIIGKDEAINRLEKAITILK